jgi:hypothetical protein
MMRIAHPGFGGVDLLEDLFSRLGIHIIVIIFVSTFVI